MKTKILYVMVLMVSYGSSCLAAYPVGGWTRHNIPVTSGPQAYALESVAFGNGVFVAVGGLFRTFVSADGANWTNTTPAPFQNTVAGPTYWRSVRFLDGQFTVVGHTNVMLRSPDGVQWTLIPLPSAGGNVYVDAAYHDGRYVIGGGAAFISSTSPSNTLEWVRADPKHAANNQALPLQSVVFGEGKFVANTANMFAPGEAVFHLDGGTNWSLAGGPTTSAPMATSRIIYEEGRFLLSQWRSSLVYTSTDGVAWQAGTGLPGEWGYHPLGMASGTGHWVSAGTDGNGGFRFYSSTNATDWVFSFNGTDEPRFSPTGAAFGHGTFVVVGEGITSLNTYQSGQVGPSLPVSPVLGGVSRLANGSFRFAFTNVTGASFTTLASTNLAAGDWTVLGSATEISAGQYQFTDPAATNNPLKFYQIRSP